MAPSSAATEAGTSDGPCVAPPCRGRAHAMPIERPLGGPWRDPAGWLGRLAGPLFEKELRVSARRRRYYVLRFAYLGVLTAYVALVWTGAFRSASNVEPGFRMASVGQRVTDGILSFQFWSLQLVTAVMLSTAISEEARRRTLNVLMASPVGGFRVGLGKLLGGMLQVLLLLATSLPLLVVVRVFGGVTWEFVVAGVCTTAAACFLVGALAVALSAAFRRAYQVVVLSILLMVGLLLPYLIVGAVPGAVLSNGPPPMKWVGEAAACAHPYAAYHLAREQLYSPGPQGLTIAGWMGGTAVSVAMGLLLLAWSGRRIEAMKFPVARLGSHPILKRRPEDEGVTLTGVLFPPERLRRMTDCPLVWHEMETHFWASRTDDFIIGLIVMIYTAGAVGSSLFARVAAGGDDAGQVFAWIGVFLFGMSLLWVAFQGAVGIAAEKESSRLTLLLASPMRRTSILAAKTIGALHRTFPFWASLAVHVLLHVVLGLSHPLVLVHLGMLVAGTFSLVLGTGLYFSASVNRRTTAAALNVGLMIVLLVAVPVLVSEVGAGEGGGSLGWAYHPVAQALAVMEGAGRYFRTCFVPGSEGLLCRWPGSSGGQANELAWPGTTRLVGATSAACFAVGMLFAWRARRKLQRSER